MTNTKPANSKVENLLRQAGRPAPRKVTSFRFPVLTEARLEAEMMFRRAQGITLNATDLVVECVRRALKDSPSAEIALEIASQRDPSLRDGFEMMRDALKRGATPPPSVPAKDPQAALAPTRRAKLWKRCGSTFGRIIPVSNKDPRAQNSRCLLQLLQDRLRSFGGDFIYNGHQFWIH